MSQRPTASKSAKKQMQPHHVRQRTFPDPNEPKPEIAGTTLVLILGSVFLTMIIVMIVAFVYFNNANGVPASLILPALF